MIVLRREIEVEEDAVLVARLRRVAEQNLELAGYKNAKQITDGVFRSIGRVVAAFVEFGVVASVQPAFDRLWGGAGRMYESRLGLARSLASNPMGAMHGVGVALALGSDSPVTPLDPWGSVRAAVAHHNPVQRMSVRAAFAALDSADVLVPRWIEPEEVDRALRDGDVALVVRAGPDRLAYRFDPSRDESRTARLAVDDAIQTAAGRHDVRPVDR